MILYKRQGTVDFCEALHASLIYIKHVSSPLSVWVVPSPPRGSHVVQAMDGRRSRDLQGK